MVNGGSSTLPIADRLQRLRQYASNFQRGIFDCEDLSVYPDYVSQIFKLEWGTEFPDFSRLYGRASRTHLALSVFTPGSVAAGIQSSHHLLPIGEPAEPGLFVATWAIDDAQDLLVMVEQADPVIVVPQQIWRRPEDVHLHFYSLRGSRTTRPTFHPAAMLPSMHVLAPAGEHHTGPAGVHHTGAGVHELCVSGEHIIWERFIIRGMATNISIEVCNWKTGKTVSRIDIGTDIVHVVPLDGPYLLVISKGIERNTRPCLDIYNFAPSDTTNHHVCTLQQPDGDPGEHVVLHKAFSGERPHTGSEGHFHADPSQSAIVLTFCVPHPLA